MPVNIEVIYVVIIKVIKILCRHKKNNEHEMKLKQFHY
jgi:hypothetical protein